MSQISIRQGEDYRSFESSDLPIKIGTDLNADIRILGPLSIGIVLLLDSLDRRPFVQVVNEKMEILMVKSPPWPEACRTPSEPPSTFPG